MLVIIKGEKNDVGELHELSDLLIIINNPLYFCRVLSISVDCHSFYVLIFSCANRSITTKAGQVQGSH